MLRSAANRRVCVVGVWGIKAATKGNEKKAIGGSLIDVNDLSRRSARCFPWKHP